MHAIRTIAAKTRRIFARFGIELTWRSLVAVGVVCLLLFSVGVVLLELSSSRLAKSILPTTFVATLETQNLSFRTNSRSAQIPGISGTQISVRDQVGQSVGDNAASLDLSTLLETESTSSPTENTYVAAGPDAYLELDRFLVPAGRAVEISAYGNDKSLSLTLIEENDKAPGEVTIVWKGNILAGDSAGAAEGHLGSKRWSSEAPLVDIEGARIDRQIRVPISVSGVSTERLQLHGYDQIATSSLLSGDIQFYFGHYPSNKVELRPGEFSKFSILDAQMTNLTLTDNGLKFVLVGEAHSVKVGFFENLREIRPSLLDGLRSVESLNIIVSAIFGIFLAGLGIISLDRRG